MTVFLLELCKVHYRLLTGFSDRVHMMGLGAEYGVFGNTYRFQERAVFGIERSLTFLPSHNGTLHSACYTLWSHDFCPPDRFCGPMDRFFGVMTDCLLVWLRWLLWLKLWGIESERLEVRRYVAISITWDLQFAHRSCQKPQLDTTERDRLPSW